MNNALNIATKVYNYYYSNAIKSFDHRTSMKLAQIPADYVYDNLQKGCFIDNRCCLKHCLDLLDYEFITLDPVVKRMAYDKAFNVQSVVSDYEIDTRLKKARKQVINKLYETDKENNDLVNLFKNMNVDPDDISSFFNKTLQIN